MAALIGRTTEAYEAPVYGVFRILVALLFMQHGAQKLFGWFGGVDGSGGTASLVSMYGLAGGIELVGGLLIAVGVLTRLVALITAVEMVAAQIIVHLPRGLIPIQNGGEPSLLFLAAFLILLVGGAGRYSLEHLLLDRELF